MFDGMVMEDGLEWFWLVDLVLLFIGFVGIEIIVLYVFDIYIECNKIVVNDINY